MILHNVPLIQRSVRSVVLQTRTVRKVRHPTTSMFYTSFNIQNEDLTGKEV